MPSNQRRRRTAISPSRAKATIVIDDEVHRLKLFSRAEIARWLRQIGFRVQTRRAYGDYQLGPRQSVFICRKPK